MPRIDTRCGRNAHPGPAEGLDPWRVGWSGAGRAAGVASPSGGAWPSARAPTPPAGGRTPGPHDRHERARREPHDRHERGDNRRGRSGGGKEKRRFSCHSHTPPPEILGRAGPGPRGALDAILRSSGGPDERDRRLLGCGPGRADGPERHSIDNRITPGLAAAPPPGQASCPGHPRRPRPPWPSPTRAGGNQTRSSGSWIGSPPPGAITAALPGLIGRRRARSSAPRGTASSSGTASIGLRSPCGIVRRPSPGAPGPSPAT